MGSRITRSAALRSCSLRLPCCCNTGVVFAHAPSVRKGLGLKSPDWWGAYACSACHDAVDGRTDHGYSQRLILDRWFKGVFETQDALFSAGLLTIND